MFTAILHEKKKIRKQIHSKRIGWIHHINIHTNVAMTKKSKTHPHVLEWANLHDAIFKKQGAPGGGQGNEEILYVYKNLKG